jgi:hypothetical protein
VVPSQLMSESFNRKPNLESVSTQEPTAFYTSLVEEHAAQLMDEVFQDFTPELEGFPQPSLQNPNPRIQESSNLALRIPMEDDSVLEGFVVPFVEMDVTLESLFPPTPDEPSPSQASEGFVSKVLLGIACLSFVGSAGLWIGTQFNRAAPLPAIAQAPAVIPVINPTNVAFAQDLQQSLQTAPASSLSTLAFSQSSASASPTTLISSANKPLAIASLPQLNNPSVKLPIRNTPNASRTFAMPTLAHRTLAHSPSVNFTAAKTTPSTPLPSLTAAALPTGTLPNLDPAVASQVPPVGRSAKAGVTVQGILDLGNKSAILIARNGSTQNVSMGEVLDSSGWVFLRVENGQAIIQRGSEIRSVNGGEQF